MFREEREVSKKKTLGLGLEPTDPTKLYFEGQSVGHTFIFSFLIAGELLPVHAAY
jgi:hypothetical protein